MFLNIYFPSSSSVSLQVRDLHHQDETKEDEHFTEYVCMKNSIFTTISNNLKKQYYLLLSEKAILNYQVNYSGWKKSKKKGE